MHKAYIGLGSNLNNKKEYLENAIILLKQRAGLLISRSSIIETKPWGFISKNSFLNCVILIDTGLNPMELLVLAKTIEQEMGRHSESCNDKYQDRIIDIDILLFDNIIIDTPSLKIPHPLMHKRRFVLEPLKEIAPNYLHPRIQKTISELFFLL